MQYLAHLYAELFGAEAVLSEPDARQILAEWEAQARAHWAFRAIDDEGRVVAFFTLAESFAFFAHGAYGILNELWVSPSARSQGVGKQVLEYCAEFGRARGWVRIDVSAPPMAKWDRTFSFYEKHGFVFTGRKLKYLMSAPQTR